MTRPTRPPATPEPTRRARTVKIPAQRAQEALDVAQRRVEKLRGALDRLAKEQRAITAELADAERRSTYAAANPDLPANQPQPVPMPDTTEETTTP